MVAVVAVARLAERLQVAPGHILTIGLTRDGAAVVGILTPLDPAEEHHTPTPAS